MTDQVPSLTLMSHGARVAQFHLHDWIILVALIVIDGFLNLIEPFHRFLGRDMMTDLRYPMKSNTVPSWAVPVISVIGPILIITGIYFKKRNVYDLHHAILGILSSVLITAVLTDAIKDAVGRPRPDFFWRCFPDGKDEYDDMTLDVICHGAKSVIKEGRKSFPSGHTSWSFAGLGFFTWYLAGKLKAFDGKGHVSKLCVVLVPFLLAVMVGISRLDDYRHHWQDVFIGGLLGLTVATFCYLHFFPLPSDDGAMWPRACHLEIMNLRSNDGHAQTGMNLSTKHDVEMGSKSFNRNDVEIESSSSALPEGVQLLDEGDTRPLLNSANAGWK